MKNIFMAVACILLMGCVHKEVESIRGNKYVTTKDGLNISLIFDKDTDDFYGQAVNNYFGTYTDKNSNIKFSLGGTTMMAAPENLMEAEAVYLKFLDEVTDYEIVGNKLILKNEKQSMNFEKNKED